MREDAQTIVEGVHRELESCHPLTVVGVALFMLNSRMPKQYQEHKRSDQEISDLIERGLNNIKEKYERIRALERSILPPRYFQRRDRGDMHDQRRGQQVGRTDWF